MADGFWARRRPGLVLGGGTIVLSAVTLLLLRADHGPDTVAVLGFPLAVFGTGVALWGLRPQPPLTQTARRLAERVRDERNRALREALAESGDPRPADVAYRNPRPDTEPALVGWRDDHGEADGTLTQLVDYYQGLTRGRLVILGEPGAGKTVAANHLVRNLSWGLPEQDPPAGGKLLIPVLFSLPSWDSGPDVATANGDRLRSDLDGQLIGQLMEAYRVGRRHATELVTRRWILPVLDGLDEMDSPDQPTRPRAAAVVRALNSHGDPVVLVCRRADYTALASLDATARAGAAPVLQDAQQIILKDLTYEQITAYLAHRFPDPDRSDRPHPRWRPMLDALAADVDRSGLAGILGHPWQLFLACTAYHRPDSDPTVLTTIPLDTLDDHLLEALIPTLTAHRPRKPRSREHYDPDDVRRWLSTLAGHLRESSRRHGWSPTDLRLDLLWPIAGWRSPRYVATALTYGPLLGLLGVGALMQASTTSLGLIAAGMVAVLAGVWRTQLVPRARELERLNHSQLRTSVGRRRFFRGLVIGLAAGLASGVILGVGLDAAIEPMSALPSGLVGGIALGLAGGVAGGFAIGAAGDLNTVDRPSQTLRDSLAHDLFLGLALGLAIGAVPGIASARLTDLVVGLTLGLLVGPPLGFTYSRWPRYWVAVAIAARRGLLPRRPAAFLDWAYDAGLLRLAGASVEVPP